MKKLLALVLAAAMVLALVPMTAMAATTLPSDVDFDTNGGTVYCADTTTKYFPTLLAALEAIEAANLTSATLYCKPDADVGTMTHGDVIGDLTIYGNGAAVTGGEHDLAIDTYALLTKDITVKVYDLNGIAAWGQRNTNYTANLYFNNCKNMNRVYISGTAGENNITLENCSFVAGNGSSQNTSVYSNNPGTISVKDCEFNGIAIPINLNNKSNGTQTVIVEDSTFTNCSSPALAAATSSGAYAAPIRIVAQKNATTNLTVKDVDISGENTGNGDILLGDGRADGTATPGTVTLAMSGTAAEVAQQSAGYYDANGGVANAANNKVTEITAEQTAVADNNGQFTVKDPEPEASPIPEEAPIPETGDGMGLFVFAGLALISMLGMAMMKKREEF